MRRIMFDLHHSDGKILFQLKKLTNGAKFNFNLLQIIHIETIVTRIESKNHSNRNENSKQTSPWCTRCEKRGRNNLVETRGVISRVVN